MMQPCSVAKLLSAIFTIPLEEGYKATGLVCCPICDKAGTKPEYYPYCGLQHQRRGMGLGVAGAIYIEKVCEICDKHFSRPLSHLLRDARTRDRRGHTGDYHVLCSNSCQGRWLADNHGIKPGDKRSFIKKNKHDYDAIWARHLETGDGGTKIAEHFGIPLPTIYFILKKMKARQKETPVLG